MPRMAWAEKASKKSVNPCPCLQNISKSAHMLRKGSSQELQTLRAFQTAARCGGTKASVHKPGEQSSATSMEEIEREQEEAAVPIGEEKLQLAPSDADDGEPERIRLATTVSTPSAKI